MQNMISWEQVDCVYDSLKHLKRCEDGAEVGLVVPIRSVWEQDRADGDEGECSGVEFVGESDDEPGNQLGYDANGKTALQPGVFTSPGYEVENWLVSSVLSGGGTERYGYGPDRKRV